MAQALGLPDALARTLAGRGVTLAGAETFLEPTLRALMPDPSVLRDMDAAAERIAAAVLKREHVAVFGDYDVDGATSAALIAGYLTAFGATVTVRIPDRLTEGYGPSVPIIEELAGAGATLLIAVDCGTASHEPFSEAVRLGLDVVVFDHHQAPDVLPAVTALVNPNRQDDVSGLGQLAACGVVFMALVATSRRLRQEASLALPLPDLMASLDLVALGTVADVMPLTGLNRAFVRQGLKLMRMRQRPGLTALMDVVGLKEAPEAYHLGFLIGPRINAGGRIGDAALGSRLLLEADPMRARAMAEQLDTLNRERQAIEHIMLADAFEQAERQIGLAGTEPPVLVSGSDAWHPGVVGLVAARLKERYRRPAFAMAWGEGDFGTGSARSISGVDIGAAVRAAVTAGLAVKGGGHAMAAGVTLRREQAEAFLSFISERLAAKVDQASAADRLLIDAALTAGAATPQLLADINRAAPFGQGNPEPVFVFPAHEILEVQLVGDRHLRTRLRAGDGCTLTAMAFGAADQPLGFALNEARGRRLHIAGTLSLNRWNGTERVDLRIIDVAVADGV